jgi:hypothetical protein
MLQRLFLQFHELQHSTWTDFHAHTAGRHPTALQDEMLHWQLKFPNMITTKVPNKIPDWSTDNHLAAVSTEDSEGSSNKE